jgi:hypothetical protein
MLHNDDNLFETFRLTKTVHSSIRDVDVEVALQVGADSFVYRATVDVDENPTFVEDRIRIPLTWDYVKGIKESVRTTMFIQIGRGDELVYRDTRRLSLQPVQEWQDTDADRVWLPSFVLPRDPAVAQVVARAERYLCTLADDPGAGFDGYQSVDLAAEDPGAPVDLQVRALWSALVHDFSPAYINPPPSYAYASQRLRTPSEVIETGHGTCIDLTLLLAACLEYVDVYPVVFLLRGHAFPGYWRAARYYDEFIGMRHVEEDMVRGSTLADGVSAPKPWMVRGEQSHAALLNSVRRDALAPIESVALTQRLGFAEAIEQGLENLAARDEFEFMVDIPLARLKYGVTPLPL